MPCSWAGEVLTRMHVCEMLHARFVSGSIVLMSSRYWTSYSSGPLTRCKRGSNFALPQSCVCAML
jgi:hypothetical protein